MSLVPGPGLDIIEIHGRRARGHHGVLAEERASGQIFMADVSLAVDARAAARSDELADTVDYSVIAQLVHAELAGDPVDLIETLTERIAERCLAVPGVHAVEIHHDAYNAASGRVAEKAGFTAISYYPRAPEAPDDSGTARRWVMLRG